MYLLEWSYGFFYSINKIYCIRYFLDFKLILHLLIKFHLVMVHKPFYILVELLANILFKIFDSKAKYLECWGKK